MKVYLMFYVVSSLIPFSLSGRSDIVSSSLDIDSWITNENFSTMIKLSFPYSECCNIYLSEPTYDVEILFNQFRNIYPYEYLLRRRTYECQGYFLLGKNDEHIAKAMKRVPSLISSTEILIIIDGDTVDGSNLFNVSLYENAIVNIVSWSGIWTLSENYLAPRVFEKVDRYDQMIQEYDYINLRGRELQVCTFFQPPGSYLNKTTLRTINGVETEVFLADSARERDGIEMQIFLIMAEKLNFTWIMRKPEGPYRYGRRYNETGWNGGVIQMLREQKIDMSFASIWLTSDHNDFVNLSEPWHQMFIHFLVPRPKPTTSFWALTRPFSVNIWILLISAILAQTLYTFTRGWIDPKFPKRFRNFLTTLIDVIGSLLGAWIPKKLSNVKLQMLLWQTAGWLIITAYCSSLAARLASSEYEDRIDTVRQFLEANLSWGRTGQIPPFYNYFDLTDPYSKQLPSRYRHIDRKEQVHEFVMEGNYAVLGKIIDSCFFPEDFIPNDDLKNYRLMKQMVGKFYATFAVQPWLLRPVNRIMLWIRQTGISLFHLRDVIRRRDNFNLREVLIEHDGNDGTARVLGLTPLAAGFSMLLVGLLISCVVFYIELRYASGSRSIRDVIREIERKRKHRNAKDTSGKAGKSRS